MLLYFYTKERILYFGLAPLIALALTQMVLQGCSVSQADDAPAKSNLRQSRWESDVRQLELTNSNADRGGVVFVGSSSIRLWDSLQDDMAPMRVVQSGFGGALTREVLHYADRLVTRHEPRAVVYYAGDNDLAASSRGTAVSVRDNFRAFVERVRRSGQNPEIYFISIKPSPRRASEWDKMAAANRQIERYVISDRQLHFIDVSQAMLDSEGRPKDELFAADGLHLNDRGYSLWSSLIKPVVQDQVGPNPYYL